MKNLIKFSLVFAAAIMILASCNKEKAAVKKLSGTWKLDKTTASVTGENCSTGTPVESTTEFMFESYTVGEAPEKGKLMIKTTTAGTSSTDTLDYNVSDDAKELTLSVAGITAVKLEIKKLTGKAAQFIESDSITVITNCTTFETKTEFGTITWDFSKK